MDDDEALILEQARRALNPTSADRRRVLQSLLPRLTPTATTPLAASDNPVSKAHSRTLSVLGSAAVLGAVALSGGLGYWKGFEAGIAQQNPRVAEPNAALFAPAAATPTRPPELAPSISPEPDRERAAPSVPSTRPASGRSTPATPRVLSEVPRAPAELGLDEEVRRLRRVERAIRESNPRLALVLLEDLNRAIPAGQLLEERRAASIMANCQLGADNAASDARTFEATHAGSAYLSRVVEICRLTSAPSERISPAPGTDVPR